MARVKALPKISKCVDPEPRTESMTEMRLFSALIVAVVIALLGVGHVYLQGQIRELRAEQRQLQDYRNERERDLDRLQGEYAARLDMEALPEIARRDFGMVEADPMRRQVASLSEDMKQRYLNPPAGRDAAPAPDLGVALAETQAPLVHKVFLSLVDSGRALAATGGQQ